MSRLKRLTAIIMAPVLGCTVLAAPGVAAAAEETTDLKMNCFIKQGPAKSYSNDVNGAYSQAWVWQLAEYDFSMSLTADAPATAVVGQPVTYSIKSSQVKLSNPIKWRSWWSMRSLSFQDLSQGRLLINAPEGATNVSVTGDNAKLNGNAVRVGGDTDTDHISAGSDAPNQIGQLQSGGLAGWAGSKNYTMDFSGFDLTFTPTQAGDLQPILPRTTLPSDGKSGVAASQAMFTAFAHMKYNNKEEGNYLFRCTPREPVQLPKVHVVQVGSVTLGAQPSTVVAGEKVTYTATAHDTDGNPVAGANATITIGGKAFNGVTNDQGVFTQEFTTEQPGQLAATAAVSDVTSAPVTVTVQKPAPVAKNIKLNVPETAKVGDDVTVTAQVLDDENQPFDQDVVDLTLGDAAPVAMTKTQTGTFEHTFKPETVGNLAVKATAGTLTASGMIAVSPKDSEVVNELRVLPETQTVTVGEQATVTAKVIAKDNSEMTGQPVTFTVGDKSVPAVEKPAGSYTFTMTPEEVGQTEVVAKLGDKQASATIIAEAAETVDRVTLAIENTNDSSIITVNVIGTKGHKLADTDVVVHVGDQQISGKTDEHGRFQHTIQRPKQEVKVKAVAGGKESVERTIVPVGSSTSEEPGTSEDPETTTPTTKPSEPSESQGSSQSSDPDDSTNGSGPGSERTWKIIAAVLGATFIGGLIYAIARYLRLTP